MTQVINVLIMSHRVDRVLSFFSSRRNWDSPNPSPTGECRMCPPSGFWGRGNSLAREGLGPGSWESPNSDEGTYTVVLFIYMYVLCSKLLHMLTCINSKKI
jgi:hypothetical protein